MEASDVLAKSHKKQDRRKEINVRSLKRVIIGLASTIGFYVGWYLLTVDGLGIIPPLRFPSPSMVIRAFLNLSLKVVLIHIGMTCFRLVIGWGIGIIAGIGVGMAMCYNKTLYRVLDPLIESFRPVPVIALLPFFILWFGIGETGKIIMILLGVFMIMVVNAVESVHNFPPIYIRAAQSLGADKRTIYRTVVFPGIMPALIAGFRITSAIAFTLVVAAEFMGAQAGLGYMIMQARRTLTTETIFLGCIIFGLVSTAIDRAIRKSTGYLTRWEERA